MLLKWILVLITVTSFLKEAKPPIKRSNNFSLCQDFKELKVTANVFNTRLIIGA